jgi:hypothetical protein
MQSLRLRVASSEAGSNHVSGLLLLVKRGWFLIFSF